MSETNEAKSQESGKKKENGEEKRKPYEYRLVLYMLASLTLLLVFIVLLPVIVPSQAKDLFGYYKWLLPALLGAFGAWIGAGAAYFFGRENLELSNKSTQDALETQQKMNLGKSLIKDINPTPLNKDFIFKLEDTVKTVLDKLDDNVDYWFVPVWDGQKMKDVIHTEALWRYKNVNPDGKLSDVIKYIDSDEKIKAKAGKLHGFFIEVTLDDNVEDIQRRMNRADASVGIVCDEQSKPTHCFSRKDLRSFLLGGG